ncbi:hypothetical protein C7M84_003586 [Penaeus vannamei]|uniref:Uncharacterized protein n=1 Tax=Penaeus vannamei TaxID=6689 RepID=A0A423TMM3_PENVA|nr:hypothetical protein C7M84_003586 [Penaeus vannamei]
MARERTRIHPWFCGRLVVFALTAALAMCGEDSQDAPGRTRIVSFQRDLWKPSSNESYLRCNLTRASAPFREFSRCGFRFAQAAEYSTFFSYATDDSRSDEIVLNTEWDKARVYITDAFQINSQAAVDLHPELWMQLCHVITESTHTVYLQGKVATRTELVSGERIGREIIPSSGVLILGQDQDSLGGDLDRLQAFRGDIGSLEMWDFPLTSAEVRQIASCQRRPSGSVVSLDTDDFESFGDVQEVWVDFDYFCRPQINRPYYMIYPSKIHKNENIHLCYLMNTTLPVPKDDIDNQLLYTELGLLKNMCNFPQFMLWLGIVRDNGSDQWLNMYTKTPITYSNFHSRFPKGGSAYFCGYMTNDGRWSDAYCQYSRCGACLLRRTDFITMRGLCFKNRLETRFYPKGYKGGKPVFHSFHGYVIFWDEGGYQWHLYNSATKQEMASLINSETLAPFGVRQWTVHSKMCDITDPKVNISLSSCGDDMFTCTSGRCTEFQKRCNYMFDCEDGSDEEDCGLVNIPKGYIQYLAPRGPRNSPLPLIPIVTLVRVAHVDTSIWPST